MMKWSSIYSAYFNLIKLKTIVLKFILMSIFLKKLFYFGLEGLNLQDRTLPAHQLRFCHCAALILSWSCKITRILQY